MEVNSEVFRVHTKTMLEYHDCVACLKATPTCLLPCKHPMCELCSATWLQRKPTCPTCRVTVLGLYRSTHRPKVLLTINVCDEAVLGLALTSDDKGVRVVRVHTGSCAHQSGIRCGDVITHINCIPVSDQERALSIIEAARNKKIVLECSILSTTQSMWLSLCGMCTARRECSSH